MAGAQVSAAMRRAANDNRAEHGAGRFDPVLADAIRHFARHGLASAEAACKAAAVAHAQHNGAAFEHWLAIARNFDRRRAAETERAASCLPA